MVRISTTALFQTAIDALRQAAQASSLLSSLLAKQPMVIHYRHSKDNPYVRLLHLGLSQKYLQAFASPTIAIWRIFLNPRTILHIHWEEHCLKRHVRREDAVRAANRFIRQLKIFRRRGSIVWTLHNQLPHDPTHLDVFLDLRQKLTEIVDRIIVHNQASIDVLEQQSPGGSRKALLLPHPSYLGVYPENVPASLPKRQLLIFGKVKPYKGIHFAINALSPEFMASHGLSLMIKGNASDTDAYARELALLIAQRDDIQWDRLKIDDAELANVFNSASCVLLPYERMLNSGVALLAMTFGTPVIGPDTPPLRETLPPAARDLLYMPGNMKDLCSKISWFFGLSQEGKENIKNALLAEARMRNPRIVGSRLGEIYDELLKTQCYGNRPRF
jgi:beta-1,4-mannosyltransferase